MGSDESWRRVSSEARMGSAELKTILEGLWR